MSADSSPRLISAQLVGLDEDLGATSADVIRVLADRVAALRTEFGDLTDHTEFLVVEPGDTEADIVRHVGFSPLV